MVYTNDNYHNKLSTTEKALVADNNLFSYTSSTKEYLIRYHLNYVSDNDNHDDFKEHEIHVNQKMMFSTLGALFDSWPVSSTHSSYWEKSVAHPRNQYHQTNNTPSTSATFSSNVINSSNTTKMKINPYAIPRFDYQIQHQRNLAESYRIEELPFIVYNFPGIIETTDSAFELPALLHHFSRTHNKKNNNHIIAEKSKTNYFMYYNNNPKKVFNAQFKYPQWYPPQTEESMTFVSFLKEVMKAEDKLSDHIRHYTREINADVQSLLYFTISATEGWQTPWIRQAFPFFTNDESVTGGTESSFFVVEPAEFKGINCRFGMKGVVSAAHYDAGRNFIAMVRGRKRYVLLPPSQCARLALLPHDHPSSRHTSVDWTDPALLTTQHPDLLSAAATEVVVSRGDILYLPSYWFHFIVSQDATIQCNARSGDSAVGREEYFRYCPSATGLG